MIKPIIFLEVDWEENLKRLMRSKKSVELYKHEVTLPQRIKTINNMILTGEAVYK